MSPIMAAIILPALGIAFSNILGWLNSGQKFDVKASIKSAILAIFTTIPTAVITLTALPESMTDLQQIAFVATYIGQAGGFDQFGKSLNKVRASSRSAAVTSKTE